MRKWVEQRLERMKVQVGNADGLKMMYYLVLVLTLKMLPTLEMKLLKLRIIWILVLAELVEMIKILDISLTIPLFFRCRVSVSNFSKYCVVACIIGGI
ncbi:hypothetical protein LINPERHAP2_LOCUS38224 [Linum perenne]